MKINLRDPYIKPKSKITFIDHEDLLKWGYYPPTQEYQRILNNPENINNIPYYMD